jgi:8-oxo-dGTP pyrophosphatase MutT (NUDIX family)
VSEPAAIAALRRRLAGPLPGMAAMRAMAPEGRRSQAADEARRAGCVEACALVLLYPLAGELHTVLTLRSATLRRHAGQVSFPGGRLDPGESVAEGALREAEEELAIPPAHVEVLAPLTPLFIPPTGYCVNPVLAWTTDRPDFRPHDPEVAALVELPLRTLTDPATRREERWPLPDGGDRLVPFYEVSGYKVWGATAMMLAELAALWPAAHEAAG